jgi:hypothetical protein
MRQLLKKAQNEVTYGYLNQILSEMPKKTMEKLWKLRK